MSFTTSTLSISSPISSPNTVTTKTAAEKGNFVMSLSSSKANIATNNDGSLNSNSNTSRVMDDDSNPRSCILQVGVSTGQLCGVANTKHINMMIKDENSISVNRKHPAVIVLVTAMADLLRDVLRATESLQLNLVLSVREKLELNKRKYPVELCKGKAGKYTQYSQQTGITPANQFTNKKTKDHTSATNGCFISEFLPALPELANEIIEFATARDWEQYHTPRNIILALLGEVGELAEIVQWKGDENNIKLSSKELEQLSHELADVTIYLLRLATVCNLVSPLYEELKKRTDSNK